MPGDLPLSHANIHGRLLDGDPTASEALVRECLTPLVRVLRRRHLTVPRDMLIDAASDALITLIQNPAGFQAERSSLLTFLVVISERRLIDQLRILNRRAGREITIGGGQDIDKWKQRPVCGESQAAYSQYLPDFHGNEPNALSPELERLLAVVLPDPTDRQLLDLICQGRQDLGDYAALLGLSGMSIPEQRAAVKRSRDRVLNRLRRRREEFRHARGSGHE